MLIWIMLAVVLVVIVTGGFVGRSRLAQRREQVSRHPTQHVTHHGTGARRSRGRGRGH